MSIETGQMLLQAQSMKGEVGEDWLTRAVFNTHLQFGDESTFVV